MGNKKKEIEGKCETRRKAIKAVKILVFWVDNE